MNSDNETFRRTLGCCGCWARDYNARGIFECRVDGFEKNRPDCVPSHTFRHQLSGKNDRQSLIHWPCEFRFSSREIELIKAGEYQNLPVSKKSLKKITTMLQTVEYR